MVAVEPRKPFKLGRCVELRRGLFYPLQEEIQMTVTEVLPLLAGAHQVHVLHAVAARGRDRAAAALLSKNLEGAWRQAHAHGQRRCAATGLAFQGRDESGGGVNSIFGLSCCCRHRG